MTSQNHGFMVDADTLPAGEFELTHWSGNDGTLEGMAPPRRCRCCPASTTPRRAPVRTTRAPWFRAFARLVAERRGTQPPKRVEAVGSR